MKIILRTLPQEYDAAVKSVRDLFKLRRYGENGKLGQITNLEDHSRINYETDWVPPYVGEEERGVK